MDTEDFFVTLPSNSSALFYPSNTIANFRTKLAKPLHFKSAYEVGLIEIQYPKTWRSFSSEDSKFVVFDKKSNKRVVLSATQGFYTTMSQIIAELNSCLSENDMGHIELDYNNITNKVSVLPTRDVELTFQGKLAQMLGFIPGVPFKTHEGITTFRSQPRTNTVLTQMPYLAPHPADVNVGMYNMFVYTDIVDHQTVGDSYVPLLRIVHISGANNHMITNTYDRPHYLRLCKTHIDSIEISLKTDQNQHIPFTYGKVIIKLHFRPVKYQY